MFEYYPCVYVTTSVSVIQVLWIRDVSEEQWRELGNVFCRCSIWRIGPPMEYGPWDENEGTWSSWRMGCQLICRMDLVASHSHRMWITMLICTNQSSLSLGATAVTMQWGPEEYGNHLFRDIYAAHLREKFHPTFTNRCRTSIWKCKTKCTGSTLPICSWH